MNGLGVEERDVPERLGGVSRIDVSQLMTEGLTMFCDLVWDDIGFTSEC
jgi:hypothetical protein